MKKLSLYITSVFIGLFLAGCGAQDVNGSSQKIDVSEPVILGSAFWEDYALVLRLCEGKYESDYSLGPDFGPNWSGQYELIVLDIYNNTVLSSYRLDEWGEPLCFHETVALNLTDLNSDGCPEVLIGQYACANYNLYRMYYIDKDMQLGYYSEIGALEISSQEMSPQLKAADGKITYPVYDNAKGGIVSKELELSALEIL